MCSIHMAKIDLALPDVTYLALLGTISPENRERCQGFKFKKDALRTLYGELMVRQELQRQGYPNITLKKNESGKPYAKGCPIYFNISHGGDYVVCAFSSAPVGIDIEAIKPVDLTIARRYFVMREYRALLAQPNRQDYFFRLWTLKESYMKWLGGGMAIPLDSFYIKTGETITVTDSNRIAQPFFKEYQVPGYKLAVCSTLDFTTEIITMKGLTQDGFYT